MKVLIAMDSFKGSLSGAEAGAAAAEGVRRVYPEAQIDICPLADGGEGTYAVIMNARQGTKIEINVSNPLGKSIKTEYGILDDGRTAVMEMAAAAGITLIDDSERNPLYTTTYGVGQMIGDAIERGCRRFVIGIGGSATNDGGIGMLSALGFEFLGRDGGAVPLGGLGLEQIESIRTDGAMPQLSECSFEIACDVTNPLCGESGCSAVYGPQKGADPETVARMDRAMARYEALTRGVLPDADGSFPGSGAAGGLGFAFRAYLGGVLRSGIELIISATGLEQKIADSDIIITGEGRLDGQSCMGKVPVGVAQAAARYSKPVVALAGGVTDDARRCNSYGIDAFFPIVKGPCSLSEAMDRDTAYKNMTDRAEQIFRLMAAVMP